MTDPQGDFPELPEPDEVPDPALQLLESLEKFDLVATTLAGMAIKLEAQGFTREQSRQIVADTFHLATNPKEEDKK